MATSTETCYLHIGMPIIKASIFVRCKTREKDILIYNLTTLATSEIIHRAELHANTNSEQLGDQTYFLDLWDIGLMALLEEYKIRKEVRVTIYNVTQVVLKCVSTKAENRNFLGLSVHNSNDWRRAHPLPVSKIIDSQKQPFLVLFSEDIEANPNRNGAHHSILDYAIHKSLKSRKKRSADDNKEGEKPFDNVDSFEKPSLISSSCCGNNANTKTQRMKRKKKKGSKHKKQEFQDKQSTYHGNDTIAIDDDQEEGIGECQKRYLIVHFRDFGWSDWIKAPAFFQNGFLFWPLQLSSQRNEAIKSCSNAERSAYFGSVSNSGAMLCATCFVIHIIVGY